MSEALRRWRDFVAGEPQPKGSPRPLHLPNGQVRLTVASRACEDWELAIERAMRGHRPPKPIDGPVRVDLEFWLRKPIRARKAEVRQCAKPDIDKLARAVLDALERCGFLEDDSRVSVLTASKWYADATNREGVVIGVTELDPCL